MSALWHCFCDETCTAKPNRYSAVGGIIVRANMSDGLHKAIDKWRVLNSMHAELKWTKIKPQKYGEYSDFIERSTKAVNSGTISFAALIADRHKLDHRTFSGGDEDVGYNKLFYQLILHRLIGRMEPSDRLIVYPDKKHDEALYEDFKSALNNGIRKKYARQRYEVVNVQGICSKTHNLAQVNDLFLGAVGCFANCKDINIAKLMLAQDIATQVGLEDLSAATPFGWDKFQIWRFQLQERMQKGATIPSLAAPRPKPGP